MKTRILWLSLIAISFTACPKSDPEPDKSNACSIVSFKVGNDTWQITGTSITFQYPKGTPESELTPSIVISDNAHIDPVSGVAQNFFTSAGIPYTVTAEDGKTTKTYTAKATVAIK